MLIFIYWYDVQIKIHEEIPREIPAFTEKQQFHSNRFIYAVQRDALTKWPSKTGQQCDTSTITDPIRQLLS
jgi:hypothetical protein